MEARVGGLSCFFGSWSDCSKSLAKTKEITNRIQQPEYLKDKTITPIAKETFKSLVEAKLKVEKQRLSDFRWNFATFAGFLAAGDFLTCGVYFDHGVSAKRCLKIALAAISICVYL